MGIVGAYMVPHPKELIPDIGRGKEWKYPRTIEAYRRIAQEIREIEPETILVISPHAALFQDYFHIFSEQSIHGDFQGEGAGQIRFDLSNDTELVNEIERLAEGKGFPAGTKGQADEFLDVGTMVPLYFIQQVYSKFKLVRIGISDLSDANHQFFGRMIARATENTDRRVVVLASGDLSHRLLPDSPYGYMPEGKVYDEALMKVMGEGDFFYMKDLPPALRNAAGECGHRAFLILSGILQETDYQAEAVSYESPYGIGHGVCAYYIREKDDPYVKIAKKALQTYVRTKEQEIPLYHLPREMEGKKGGVYVSLYVNGILRGSMGTVEATQDSLAREIVKNTISAGAFDPRHQPVTEEELESVEYSVEVVSEPEIVTSARELDAKRYGVIVTNGWDRGIVLPGRGNVRGQVEKAMVQAGISEKEPVQIKRFELEEHRGS